MSSVDKTSFLDIDSIADCQSFIRALTAPDQPSRISNATLEGIVPSWWFTYISTSSEESAARRAICEKISNFAYEHVCQKFATDAERDFVRKKWKVILDQAWANTGVLSPSSDDYLSATKVHNLMHELLGDEEYGGTIAAVEIADGVKPLADSKGDVEILDGDHTRNLMKYFMHPGHISLSSILNCTTFLTWLCNPDANQTQKILTELQDIFDHLFYELRSSATSPSRKALLECFLGHMICALGHVYTGAKGEPCNVNIPQKIDGLWEQVSYTPRVITLSPTWMCEVITATELTPTFNTKPGLLLFKGTQSFVSLAVDATPFTSVGCLLYKYCSDKIDACIQRYKEINRSNVPLQLYGVSLGGTMTYHVALNHPEDVEIHAYAPPGLYSHSFPKDEKGERVKIKGEVYADLDDFVPTHGSHPLGTTFNRVVRGTSQPYLINHICAYAGEDTILLRVNLVWENQKSYRTWMAIIHEVLSPIIFLLSSTVIVIHALFSLIARLFYYLFCRAHTEQQPKIDEERAREEMYGSFGIHKRMLSTEW